MYGAQRVAQRNLNNMRLSVAKINGRQDEVRKKPPDGAPDLLSRFWHIARPSLI